MIRRSQPQSGEPHSRVAQLINTGQTHQRQGDFNQALANYQRALALAQVGSAGLSFAESLLQFRNHGDIVVQNAYAAAKETARDTRPESGLIF